MIFIFLVIIWPGMIDRVNGLNLNLPGKCDCLIKPAGPTLAGANLLGWVGCVPAHMDMGWVKNHPYLISLSL